MHTKTMEGLAGASTNMKLLNTPFRVYKEAERKGDTATMERAMGYVGEFSDKAEDYQKKAEKGMKEDAKAARDKAKAEQEEAARRRKEEREEQEKRIEESKNKDTDTVSISEGGKAAQSGNSGSNQACADQDSTDSGISGKEITDSVKPEPVIYTNNGEPLKSESGANLSVSI